MPPFGVALLLALAGPGSSHAIERGVAALHDYAFRAALEEFRGVQASDPGNVMAYWGEAMAYFRPLWGWIGLDEMREVLGRLGPTPAARQALARTDEERLYLGALEALVAPGELMERRRDFAEAMEALARLDPSAVEPRAFLAHARWGLWPDGLPDGESLERIAELAQSVLADDPNHAGGLHYLVHALDSPDRAWRALAAAERYARVASTSSPHALHMPSHTFLQLAMWDEVIRSNVGAFDASARIVEERSLSKESLDFHAIDFLLYARLQKGLYRDARETLALLSSIEAELGDRAPWLSDYVRSKRAVYAVETEFWEPLGSSADRGTLLANARSAIHRRRFDDAELLLGSCRAEAAKADAVSAELFKWRAACGESEGLLRFRRGATSEGLALLEAAHRHELEAGPAWETPDPVKPPAELLAELYLELGLYDEAASAFEATLARRPGRSRSLLGLARALRARGSDERAREIYVRLNVQWEDADESVPELKEARTFGQLAP